MAGMFIPSSSVAEGIFFEVLRVRPTKNGERWAQITANFLHIERILWIS